ncbi:hypothetical protein PGTUg99_035883 [Puccinia graminis f. sp. tritici]|uniref:Tyr recombinase domain-containing protein n=1 Tax=Puccinia graminis f. sp. tritici TaxID=56615 RepID=A0A5B0QUY6_PUCGR|nr:hypothetical protein PGTUg99_035883 [Puccinia graminis f. sp. tritici]
MIKSSTYIDIDTPKKPCKMAVTIKIMVKLTELLSSGDPFQRALFDLSVVAFWGMARLVELTYNNSNGPLWRQALLLTSDVHFNQEERGNNVTLVVRGAKKASPGEELLNEAKQFVATNGETLLFGFTGTDGSQTHITKPVATRALDKIWKAQNFEGVSGHCFRVGGASIQKDFRVPDKQICVRGRWNSDCYKLYLREFPSDKLKATFALLNRLEECWTRSTLKEC